MEVKQRRIHHHPAQPAQHQCERAGQIVGGRIKIRFQRAESLASHIGGGHKILAHRLGQRADQRGEQLVAQPRNQPAEPRRIQLVEEDHRNLQAHPITFPGGGRRVVLVAQRQLDIAVVPGGGEGLLIQLLGVGF